MSSPIVQLLGEFLLEGTTKVNTADKMADVDAVGIYFSAHWCGPCRGFTPQLAKAYTQMKAAGKKFEVSIMHSSGEREIERKMPYVYYACCKKKTKKRKQDAGSCCTHPLVYARARPGVWVWVWVCCLLSNPTLLFEELCAHSHILMKFFLIFPTVLMKLFYCFPWHWKRESLL